MQARPGSPATLLALAAVALASQGCVFDLPALASGAGGGTSSGGAGGGTSSGGGTGMGGGPGGAGGAGCDFIDVPARQLIKGIVMSPSVAALDGNFGVVWKDGVDGMSHFQAFKMSGEPTGVQGDVFQDSAGYLFTSLTAGETIFTTVYRSSGVEVRRYG